MENSNLTVVLKSRRPFKINNAFLVLLHKEKIAKFYCSHSHKRITPVYSIQKSEKNEKFMTFVGHFLPEKSDIKVH